MRYIPVALGFLLLVGACGKFDIYEENLRFMTDQTLAAEHAATARRVEEAAAYLAQAQASGDAKRVQDAKEFVSDAKAQAKAVASEERSRSHSRSRTHAN